MLSECLGKIYRPLFHSRHFTAKSSLTDVFEKISSFALFLSRFASPRKNDFMHDFVWFLYDDSLDEEPSKAKLRTVWRSWINKILIVRLLLFISFDLLLFAFKLKLFFMAKNHKFNLVSLFSSPSPTLGRFYPRKTFSNQNCVTMLWSSFVSC